MIVWSRCEDNDSRQALGALVRHFIFPHDFSTLTYHLWEDKELGTGPPNPCSVFKRGDGCHPEEDSSALAGLGERGHSASETWCVKS